MYEYEKDVKKKKVENFFFNGIGRSIMPFVFVALAFLLIWVIALLFG
jgi:hypothetical protein